MRTWDFLPAAGIFRLRLGSMEFGLWGLRRVGREGDALFVLWCVFTTKTVIFNWNFHEKSLNSNFPSYRKENGVSSS